MSENVKPALEHCPFCDNDMDNFAGMFPEAFARGHGSFTASGSDI